jgi:3,4-dihydroxy 2-butanone 4-phosphate synthase/GTP cyclohydrolase II
MKFDTISSAIKEIKAGGMVVVLDNEDRENEGDLVMASDAATPENINFMAIEGRGLICISVSKPRAKKLDLEPMEQKNTSLHETAFTVSVDAIKGTTTGISASDRCKTIKTIVSDKTNPSDLARPGHIFPIVGRNGGVLRRAGHTEASMDLAQLAGFSRSGVICEIIGDDGEMLRGPQLLKFAKQHNLKIISIEDLIRFRRKEESIIEKVEEIKLPTKFGDFDLHMYDDIYNNKVHFGLTYGKIDTKKPILIRVHSECLTGDIFHSLRCDCGSQLDFAMKKIVEKGSGIVVYLRQEGRGIGIRNKIKAYKLQQEKNLDTVEANNALGFKADLRDYGVGAQILKDLGAKELIVMTNNPKKLIGLEGHDLKIADRVPVNIKPSEHNEKYLSIKKTKLNHMLD